MMRVLLSAALIALLGAGVANAAIYTITYDFTGDGENQTFYSVEPDSVIPDEPPLGSFPVVVTPILSGMPTAFGHDVTVTDIWVNQSSLGFGIDWEGWYEEEFRGLTWVKKSDDGTTEIDGSNTAETLRVTFPEQIVALSAKVTSIDSSDQVKIAMASGILYSGDPGLDTEFIDLVPGNAVLDRTGSYMDFSTIEALDDYRVSQVTITFEDSKGPGPAHSPEPASMIVWGLLAAGAAGLGVWRRRRRGATGAPWSEENRRAIRQIIGRGRTNPLPRR